VGVVSDLVDEMNGPLGEALLDAAWMTHDCDCGVCEACLDVEASLEE
jgi:hypothetical protein